ncbi:hypothetical protein ACFE04_022540 [Oxalis oulophora]
MTFPALLRPHEYMSHLHCPMSLLVMHCRTPTRLPLPSIRLPYSRGFTLAPTPGLLFPRLLMFNDDLGTFSVNIPCEEPPIYIKAHSVYHFTLPLDAKDCPPTLNHSHLWSLKSQDANLYWDLGGSWMFQRSIEEEHINHDIRSRH